MVFQNYLIFFHVNTLSEIVNEIKNIITPSGEKKYILITL